MNMKKKNQIFTKRIGNEGHNEKKLVLPLHWFFTNDSTNNDTSIRGQTN